MFLCVVFGYLIDEEDVTFEDKDIKMHIKKGSYLFYK